MYKYIICKNTQIVSHKFTCCMVCNKKIKRERGLEVYAKKKKKKKEILIKTHLNIMCQREKKIIKFELKKT